MRLNVVIDSHSISLFRIHNPTCIQSLYVGCNYTIAARPYIHKLDCRELHRPESAVARCCCCIYNFFKAVSVLAEPASFGSPLGFLATSSLIQVQLQSYNYHCLLYIPIPSCNPGMPYRDR